VFSNSALLWWPWHTNITEGETVPDYTPKVQGAAVAFVAIFVVEVSLVELLF